MSMRYVYIVVSGFTPNLAHLFSAAALLSKTGTLESVYARSLDQEPRRRRLKKTTVGTLHSSRMNQLPSSAPPLPTGYDTYTPLPVYDPSYALWSFPNTASDDNNTHVRLKRGTMTRTSYNSNKKTLFFGMSTTTMAIGAIGAIGLAYALGILLHRYFFLRYSKKRTIPSALLARHFQVKRHLYRDQLALSSQYPLVISHSIRQQQEGLREPFHPPCTEFTLFFDPIRQALQDKYAVRIYWVSCHHLFTMGTLPPFSFRGMNNRSNTVSTAPAPSDISSNTLLHLTATPTVTELLGNEPAVAANATYPTHIDPSEGTNDTNLPLNQHNGPNAILTVPSKEVWVLFNSFGDTWGLPQSSIHLFSEIQPFILSLYDKTAKWPLLPLPGPSTLPAEQSHHPSHLSTTPCHWYLGKLSLIDICQSRFLNA